LQPSPQPEVQAAGGVVRRNGGVMIVHRPKYDDWTFPKGKLEEGESPEEAALREVQEETAWGCELARPLQPSRYSDDKGREKIVHWWEMWARERGRWEPGDEVDDVLWVPLTEVDSLLTYESDRVLAAEVRALDPPRPPGI
jgi:8-oxo-dGTP pyrophosphatase MutT (NUDIX family)